jgi:hypothetical protein
MMLSCAPAARRKFRRRTLSKPRRADDQRKAEKSDQQDCRNAPHRDY